MDMFWKGAAGILIAVVLCLSLGKDMGLMLSLAVCTMGSIIALEYLEPVLDLLTRVEALADLDNGMLSILLKASGIAVVAEVSAMVCADAGCGSLGKAIRFLGSSVILWMSVPLFQAVISVLQQILGEI